MLWVTWLWMLPFTSSSLENYFYYRTFNCLQRKKALFLHRIVFLQDYGNTWQGVTRNTLNREKYCKFDLPTHSKEHNKIISKLTVLTLFGNLELRTSSATLAEGRRHFVSTRGQEVRPCPNTTPVHCVTTAHIWHWLGWINGVAPSSGKHIHEIAEDLGALSEEIQCASQRGFILEKNNPWFELC